MSGRTIIYGLCDPATGELRYVGKTQQSLQARFLKHVSSKGDTHRERWVSKLVSAGARPEIFVIEEVYGTGAVEETHYIAYFKSLGCRLTNATAGGEGTSGHKHSAESKALQSAARAGRPISEAQRAMIGRRHRGKQISAEMRARLSVVNTGKTLSAEHRAKIAAAGVRDQQRRRSERFFGMLVRTQKEMYE